MRRKAAVALVFFAAALTLVSCDEPLSPSELTKKVSDLETRVQTLEEQNQQMQYDLDEIKRKLDLR